MQLPGQEPLFSLVRRSCAEWLASSADVALDETSVSVYASSLDPAKVIGVPEIAAPLRFQSVREHINFLAIVSLLNFGSGYRIPLKQHANRGAFETILRGCMGFHLTNTLNADFMVQVGLSDVSQTFDLPIDVDIPLQPAIYTTKPHILRPLVENIRRVLNESAGILRARQCLDFAQFILNDSPGGPRAEEKKQPLLAADVVTRLVTTFPAFNDRHQSGARMVFFFKKAQFLVAELYRKLRQEEPRFDFPDIEQLTCMADNVIPAVLRTLGVLRVSDSLLADINSETDISGDKVTSLRAAAVVAVDKIVSAFNGSSSSAKITGAQLDYYLWTLGKEGDMRKVTRHIERNTVFY